MNSIVKDEYTFRTCEISDISDISVLINKVLKANRNDEYWTWKYFKNPAGEALSALCEINGKVVGQLGAIPVRFLIKGKQFTAAQEIDVAILKEHRRLDTFLKMVSFKNELQIKNKIKFSYSFTNELTSEIAKVFCPKSKISAIPRLVRVLDIRPFLEERYGLKTFSKYISIIVNSISRLIYPQNIVVPEGMKIQKIKRFDKRFDHLWNQVKEDYPIISERDAPYLNWRYADSTSMKYDIICLEKLVSKEIAGFIVLGERETTFPVGLIYEIVTPRSEDGSISNCLINLALKHFRKKKVAVVRCWTFPHCHIFSELIKSGFKNREKKGSEFVFKMLGNNNCLDSNEYISNIHNWFISIGDSDLA